MLLKFLFQWIFVIGVWLFLSSGDPIKDKWFWELKIYLFKFASIMMAITIPFVLAASDWDDTRNRQIPLWKRILRALGLFLLAWVFNIFIIAVIWTRLLSLYV